MYSAQPIYVVFLQPGWFSKYWRDLLKKKHSSAVSSRFRAEEAAELPNQEETETNGLEDCFYQRFSVVLSKRKKIQLSCAVK